MSAVDAMATASSTTSPAQDHQPVSSSSPDHHDSSMLSQSLPRLLDESAASPSAADAEKHPKGKRKRTAAKDKMVLEDAYRNNPKPDKQARLDIVDRVSLSEKEVQIWFQNRRQNDRRKSRPLSPEELAALRYGGMHHITSDPVISRSITTDSELPFPSSDPVRTAEHGPVSPPCTQARPELCRSYSEAAIATPRVGHSIGNSVSAMVSDATPSQSQEAPSSQKSHDSSESMTHSFSGSMGYLANRWNIGSSFSTPSTLARGGDDSIRLETFPTSCSSDKTHNRSTKSQSQVRLSLSLEGKAELVSNQKSPTRPPQPKGLSALPPVGQPRPRLGLSRSQSALPSITLPPISALTNSLPPRLARGRSRDVQAWQSCADSETRDELTTQAEHESNGSAIAAISLLRSSSGILQPSSTKRNASLTRPPQSRQSKKAKLSRTSSTFARMENVDGDVDKGRENASDKVKVSMLVSPTDSDKENWSPDEEGHPQEGHRRRPLPETHVKLQNPRRLGRVLQDHKGQSLLGNRANTAPTRGFGTTKGEINVFEDGQTPPVRSREDDVERFMRGEVSPSKKPDMDCVAGLLSLSQGAWR